MRRIKRRGEYRVCLSCGKDYYLPPERLTPSHAGHYLTCSRECGIVHREKKRRSGAAYTTQPTVPFYKGYNQAPIETVPIGETVPIAEPVPIACTHWWIIEGTEQEATCKLCGEEKVYGRVSTVLSHMEEGTATVKKKTQ